MCYKILATNSSKAISICADREGNLVVFTNGKYYSTSTYQPLDGEGRRLREDSINAVSALLPMAEMEMEVERERQSAALEAEIARRGAVPQKSFADALQDAFLQTLTEKASGELLEMVVPNVERQLVEKFGCVPVVHEFHIPEKKPWATGEILHEQFDNIIQATMMGEPLYLYGPAGTGKSYLAQQLAKALDLEYYYTNCVTDDIQLKGFIDARGVYHETEFYKAFVNGGIFLLDEMDASVPEALNLLNNALANGMFDFPTGKVQAHPDFHALAAGNTAGTGADDVYTGRSQLDGASLNRFGKIRVDYDDRIALSMAGGDSDLVDFSKAFRKACYAAGINHLCTYRDIRRLAKFSSFMSKEDALAIGLVGGLEKDDLMSIWNELGVGEWENALLNVAERAG